MATYMLRPFNVGTMRVDLCSSPDCGDVIDTSNRRTVADLDSTVVYVVYSEDGFTEPNGWSTPSDKCIKEAPPCDLARHIHSLQVLLPEGEAGFFGLIPRAGAREEPERLHSHGIAVSSASCLSPDMPYEPAASDPSKRRTFSSPPDRRSARAVRRDSAIPSGRGSHGAPRGRAGPGPGG